MLDLNERKTNAILRIIADADRPIGSAEIAERLKDLGINLTERAVRYYLRQTDKLGLTEVKWRNGRTITTLGVAELNDAGVSDKIGLVSSKIEQLSYLSDFNLGNRSGKVILNLTYFQQSGFRQALKLMSEVFKAELSMGQKVLLARGGETVGAFRVPSGMIAIGTLCAINLNSILLKHGIQVFSRFGGILQISAGRPYRFTELVSYDASTIDPHEIFLRSKMTSVREAAQLGEGKVLAGLREIPAASKRLALELMEDARQAGFGRPLFIGNSGEAVLGMPVVVGKVGFVVPGGLNPIAACEEWGLVTETHALSVLCDYDRLVWFKEI